MSPTPAPPPADEPAPTSEETALPAVGADLDLPQVPVETQETPPDGPPRPQVSPQAALHRLTRRSFLTGAVAGIAAIGGWRWLVTRPDADGTPWPLRWVLDANGALSRRLFAPGRLAPTFEAARARTPRANGDIGLKEALDLDAWRLDLDDEALPPGLSRRFTLAEILDHPRVEMTTQLMCIEGWSTIVTWSGVRLADVIARHAPAWADPDRAPGQYVSLTTPDGAYYVGLDLASALHPQTLLCDRMNGEPLSEAHGAPLRLVIPVKYGIKHIKRIGRIRLMRHKPADYWAEQGYDWYSGL